MQGRHKLIALGAVIGTVASLTLALPSIVPEALADEQPLKTLYSAKNQVLDYLNGPEELYKPQWTVEDYVATEVANTGVVRKIGYGRTSFVTIAETATGTYSSDGLNSPHFRYPGIHKQNRPTQLGMVG